MTANTPLTLALNSPSPPSAASSTHGLCVATWLEFCICIDKRPSPIYLVHGFWLSFFFSRALFGIFEAKIYILSPRINQSANIKYHIRIDLHSRQKSNIKPSNREDKKTSKTKETFALVFELNELCKNGGPWIVVNISTDSDTLSGEIKTSALIHCDLSGRLRNGANREL